MTKRSQDKQRYLGAYPTLDSLQRDAIGNIAVLKDEYVLITALDISHNGREIGELLTVRKSRICSE
jgi:hypothetical protein